MRFKKIFAALLAFALFTAGVLAEEIPDPDPQPAETSQEEPEGTEESEKPEEPAEIPASEETPQEEETDVPEEVTEETEEILVIEEITEEIQEALADPLPETAEPIKTSESDAAESREAIDLHETTAHAAARLREEEKNGPASSEERSADGIQTDSGMLVSRGKIASFDSVIHEGSVEFIKLYFINDRPVYCVEPDVNLRLINGQGGIYTGRTWDSLDAETRTLLKRIAYFG